MEIVWRLCEDRMKAEPACSPAMPGIITAPPHGRRSSNGYRPAARPTCTIGTQGRLLVPIGAAVLPSWIRYGSVNITVGCLYFVRPNSTAAYTFERHVRPYPAPPGDTLKCFPKSRSPRLSHGRVQVRVRCLAERSGPGAGASDSALSDTKVRRRGFGKAK